MLLTFILNIICLHQITVSVETVMTTPQLEAATMTRELELGLQIPTMTRELGLGPETATVTRELGPQIPTTTRMIPAMNCQEVCTALIDVIKSMVTVGFVGLNGCYSNLPNVSKCHEQFSDLIYSEDYPKIGTKLRTASCVC